MLTIRIYGLVKLLRDLEMKLPGEAWLEFKIGEILGKPILVQTATFKPLGVWGRLYWYLMVPFHFFIFKRMVGNILAYRA